VQNPEDAENPTMPKAALTATEVDYIVSLEQLTTILFQRTAQEATIHDTNG
jgi:chemotaxis response regulator CheB